jgi:hypothetical protein
VLRVAVLKQQLVQGVLALPLFAAWQQLVLALPVPLPAPPLLLGKIFSWTPMIGT